MKILVIYHDLKSGAAKSILLLNKRPDFKFTRLPTNTYRNWFKGVFHLVKILFISSRKKIIVLNGMAVVLNPLTVILLSYWRFRNKRIFTYWHEGEMHWIRNHSNNLNEATSINIISRLKNCNSHFIGDSQRVSDWLCQRFDLRNVYVLWEAINREEIINKVKSETQDMLVSYDSNRITIITVGSVQFRKGLKFYIDLVRKVDDRYDFVWIGRKIDWSFEFENEVTTINSKFNRERIRFVGHIDNPYTYMRNADCFMLPSIDEPFGIVYSEALALDVYCVVSPNSGFKELVTPASNSCYVYKDLDDLINFFRIMDKNSFSNKEIVTTESRKIVNKLSVNRFENKLREILLEGE